MPSAFVRLSTAFGILGALGMLSLMGAPGAMAKQTSTVDCDAVPDAVVTGPRLMVLNPAAGDLLVPDTQVVIEGAAFDCHADTGSGVDRVSVYLGSRDDGGIPLGDATLGGPTGITVLPVDQYHSAGWTLTLPVTLQSAEPGKSLLVYAHSDVTGQETMVSVSIRSAATDMPANLPQEPGGEEPPAE